MKTLQGYDGDGGQVVAKMQEVRDMHGRAVSREEKRFEGFKVDDSELTIQ